MTTSTHTLLSRVLDSLKHLHTLHGPCDGVPSPDGEGCPHAAVIARCSREMDPDPSFQAVAPFPCKPLPDYISKCCNCGTQMVNPQTGAEWNGQTTTIWWCPTCWENWTIVESGIITSQPLSVQPLSHDPHDLAAALLQAMASGATISTGVTEDVPSTIPVTRRLVVTRHGQHWEDVL